MFLTLASRKQGSLESCIPNIKAYFDAAHQKGKFNGSILFTKGKKVLLERQYGYADYEKGLPIDSHTRFDVASITKGFTALIILQLWEEGRLALQDPVKEYLQDFPYQETITLHHLLCHLSGLPLNLKGFPITSLSPIKSSKVDPIILKPGRLWIKPGFMYRYSNAGYILLGYVIEKILGISFGEALRRRILEPLGMIESGVKDPTGAFEGLATGYQNFNGEPAGKNQADRTIGPRGSGGLCATSRDLHRWGLALAGNRLISQDTLEKMLTPVKGRYGYGFQVGEDRQGNRLCEHPGHNRGFRSYFLLRPADAAMGVVLSNVVTTNTKVIAKTIKRFL